MKSSSSYLSIAGGVAVAAFALDQATKALAAANAEILASGLAVAPGFNLTFHRNTGVSFGMFDEVPSFALVSLLLAIIAWLAVRAFRAERLDDAVGSGLILGGALGNVTDRLRFGGALGAAILFDPRPHSPGLGRIISAAARPLPIGSRSSEMAFRAGLSWSDESFQMDAEPSGPWRRDDDRMQS